MKAAELGSPGTVMAAPCSSASPQMVTERPPVAVVLGDELGAEMTEHALGVIAARQRLDNGGPTRRMHAGEQDGGLHLRRGHRQIVDDGDEIGGAAHLERQRRSRVLDGKAHAG